MSPHRLLAATLLLVGPVIAYARPAPAKNWAQEVANGVAWGPWGSGTITVSKPPVRVVVDGDYARVIVAASVTEGKPIMIGSVYVAGPVLCTLKYHWEAGWERKSTACEIDHAEIKRLQAQAEAAKKKAEGERAKAIKAENAKLRASSPVWSKTFKGSNKTIAACSADRLPPRSEWSYSLDSKDPVATLASNEGAAGRAIRHEFLFRQTSPNETTVELRSLSSKQDSESVWRHVDACGGGRLIIGHVAPMTGSSAALGRSVDRGIRLAVAEYNKNSGIDATRIEVMTADDQGEPEEARAAAARLITLEHVNILLGEVSSVRSIAMAPVADSSRVPMITPGSTNPRVTRDGGKVRPFVFRVCFIDPFQGTVIAKFARNDLKMSKVAVLRGLGNEYSEGLADNFVSKFKELGGTIIDDQSYRTGDQDFRAQLTAIKGKEPEAIYVPGYYSDVALVARQARELGIGVPLMGGDGWDSPGLFQIGGKAMDGSYFSNHYSPEDPNPNAQNFVKLYKEALGTVPDSLAATGYDAAKLAIDAMLRAHEVTGPAIRDEIASTKDFSAVTGAISIDADHNPVKPAVVLKIENGAAKYAATVQPDPTSSK